MTSVEDLKAELAAYKLRTTKAEAKVVELEKSSQSFKDYYGMTRDDLVAKLKQIRELVQKDVETIAERDETIESQKKMLSHIRDQLTQVKKALLVSGAKLTSDEFRLALKGYLLDIRSQIVAGLLLYELHTHNRKISGNLFLCFYG